MKKLLAVTFICLPTFSTFAAECGVWVLPWEHLNDIAAKVLSREQKTFQEVISLRFSKYEDVPVPPWSGPECRIESTIKSHVIVRYKDTPDCDFTYAAQKKITFIDNIESAAVYDLGDWPNISCDSKK